MFFFFFFSHSLQIAGWTGPASFVCSRAHYGSFEYLYRMCWYFVFMCRSLWPQGSSLWGVSERTLVALRRDGWSYQFYAKDTRTINNIMQHSALDCCCYQKGEIRTHSLYY